MTQHSKELPEGDVVCCIARIVNIDMPKVISILRSKCISEELLIFRVLVMIVIMHIEIELLGRLEVYHELVIVHIIKVNLLVRSSLIVNIYLLDQSIRVL